MPGTVTIACAIPQGLRLRLFDIKEQLDTGARMPMHRGGSVEIFGAKHGEAAADGCWLTRGVDADFWAEWLQQNAASPLVTGRHIFQREA